MDKEQLQQKVANMEAELAEMKKLLNKPELTINYWQPKGGELYYHVDKDADVRTITYSECANDIKYRVFKTKAEAQKYADYIKAEETLRKAIAEANEGWLPNWSNGNLEKFVITINSHRLSIRSFYSDKYLPTFMYIRSEDKAEYLMNTYKNEFIICLSY